MPTREKKALERNLHIWFHRTRIKKNYIRVSNALLENSRRENGMHIIAEVQNKRVTQIAVTHTQNTYKIEEKQNKSSENQPKTQI